MILHQAFLHIFDKNSGNLLLSQKELPLSNPYITVEEISKNQITKEKHHLENHFIVVLLISVSQCIKIV